MKKIEAIISVYGKLDSSTSFKNELINGWLIENISKEELVSNFTFCEIIQIYYKAV